jgi:adenylate kinase
MIVFFGPAGAGKSMQGQMLAARQGWRWLSSGQLLRDANNPELMANVHTGKLTSTETVNDVMGEALKKAKGIDRVILDGFPRTLEQAEWLIDNQASHERSIGLIVVLEVPKSELLKRLEVRGRADDVPEAIDERLKIYRQEIYPILNYLTEQNVPIVHIDGVGSVGQVHDRIMEEVTAHKLA